MYTRDVDVDVAKSYMWLLANLLWMYLLTLVNALAMNLRSMGQKTLISSPLHHVRGPKSHVFNVARIFELLQPYM